MMHYFSLVICIITAATCCCCLLLSLCALFDNYLLTGPRKGVYNSTVSTSIYPLSGISHLLWRKKMSHISSILDQLREQSHMIVDKVYGMKGCPFIVTYTAPWVC